MKVSEIMSRNLFLIKLDTPLVEAANIMKSEDVGALPVHDGEKIRGMVTDRDIVLRSVAQGKDPGNTVAAEVMTEKVSYIFGDEDIGAAAQLMQSKKIRRLVVLDRNKRLVGLLSLGDIALHVNNDHLSASTIKEVSQPSAQDVLH